MGPYKTDLTPISDVSPYFRTNTDGSITFIGDSLEVRIPRKFSQYGMLNISDASVDTLGVCDLIINDAYHVGMNILCTISIGSDDISQMTYKGVEYVVLYLHHGSTFMKSTTLLREPNSVYVLWSIFITAGDLPYFFDYKSLLSLFEHVRELTGQGIGVSRAVFEGIIASLSRSQDDISQEYRLTEMNKPMKLVALKSISQASRGTIARLNGSYFRDDGLTSALRYQVDEHQPFEDMLRGLSSADVGDEDNATL